MLVLAAVAACVVALPFLLSSDFVKQRIEAQLGSMTGRSVSLNGAGTVSLNPYLGVSYRNVSIGETDDGSQLPLLTSERLDAKLAFFSIITGQPRISQVSLVRPEFNLRIDETGSPNWELQTGAIADGVESENNESIQKLRFGTLTVIDGRLRLDNAAKRSTAELTAINGTVSWSAITKALSASLSAVWGGELVEADATIDSPLALMRNEQSAFSLKLESKTLNGSLEGEFDAATDIAQADVSLETPSSRRLTEWLDLPLPLGAFASNITIAGPARIAATQVEFSQAEVTIGENTGQGRLLFTNKTNELPTVRGTLAFDVLSLPDPIGKTDKKPSAAPKPLRAALLKTFELDLRVSANQITADAWSLENVAASLLVSKGLGRVDIGQAQGLGGALSGVMTIREDKQPDGEDEIIYATSKINFENIQLAELSAITGDGTPVLTGNGVGSVTLKGNGASPSEIIQSLDGEGELTVTNGTLAGVDFTAMASASGEDSLEAIALGGSTEFTSLTASILLGDGTAFLREGEMTTDRVVVTARGRSNLIARSIALRGNIAKAGENNAETTPVPFFVGGTIASPLLVPLPKRSAVDADPKPELGLASQ
ncbi:MAG: AsmA family protein [Pseudomonadota bacterium]